MRKLARIWGLTLVVMVCVFFIGRAAAEPFTVGNDYQSDWGGPSLVGVLAVHMMPGLLAAAVLVWLGSVMLRRHRAPHR